MIDSIEKALVIAAHPDDEILGAGGTIPLIVDGGGSVDVLIVTDGSSTQYAGDEGTLEQKQQQAVLAAKKVGARLLPNPGFPDMKLDQVPHVDLNIALEEIIGSGGYDTVFTHGDCDINLDHRVIFESTIVSCRPTPAQPVKRLLKYYVNSSSEWGQLMSGHRFVPNVFFDVSRSIDRKIEAMSIYESELRDYPHPRSLEGIRVTAAYFGNMVGYEYGEAFELVFSR